MEQEKLELGSVISDLQVRAIDGQLTRADLEQAKRQGVFKYAPSKYATIMEKMNKQDEIFPNDEKAVEHIYKNWDKIDEKELQRLNHEGLINNKTYNHLSGQLSKVREKKKEKSEAGAKLLARARGGEDVSAAVDDAIVAGDINSETRKIILDAQAKAQGKSQVFKDTWQKIGNGEITDEAEISNIGLEDKNEITELKNYLKEVKEQSKARSERSFEELSKEAYRGDLDEETAKADPNWGNLTTKQQNDILSGIETRKETKAAKDMADAKDLIMSNNLVAEEIPEYVFEHNLSREQADELLDFSTKIANDKTGVFTAAVSFGKDYMPTGDSSAERKAREAYNNRVQEIYDNAVKAGKSPSEIGSLLNKENLLAIINELKPSEQEILRSVNSLSLQEANLKIERDAVVEMDKDTKQYKPKGDDIAPLVQYSRNLDAAREQGLMDEKTYQKNKSEIAPAMVELLSKAEKDIGSDTLLGDMYRTVVKTVKTENLSVEDRAEIIQNLSLAMTGANIPFDTTMSWWAKLKTDPQKYLADKKRYNVFAPGEIAKQEIRKWLMQKYPGSMTVEDADAIAGGNNLIYVPQPEITTSGTAENYRKERENARKQNIESWKPGADKVVAGSSRPNGGNDLIERFAALEEGENNTRKIVKDGQTYIFENRNN